MLPVPMTEYHTPGDVLVVPQKPTSSNAAPIVVPAVVEGTARGPIALTQSSFDGGAGCAPTVLAVIRNRQETTKVEINIKCRCFFMTALDYYPILYNFVKLLSFPS
jgi:hypothetical protein